MTIDAELRTGSAAALEKGHQAYEPTGEVLEGPPCPPIWTVSNNSYTQIEGIADKFRSHVIIPIVDQATATFTWTALVPGTIITELGVSVDRINDIISSQAEWNVGDAVTDVVTVRAKIGTHGLLLSTLQTDKSQQNTSVHLDESGSSANVSLVVRPDGGLEVHKTCSHDGIDENGRPWLERQNRFLETSIAVKETDIFVRPLRYTATDDHFSIDFPYLPSQTLAQLAMAGMGGPLLLAVTSALLGEMAAKVWPKTATAAPPDFIEKAHFDRIDRRVAIARAAVPELGAIVDSAEVVVNGRTLLGFHAVMAQLRSHPAIADIAPTLIGEIHGDLNLHNILCCVGADAQRQVTLIDPRGVHLLSDFAKTRDFEPGDYAYELSKLKFSLSAFSEIRHGYLTLQQRGGGGTMDFQISFAHHSGSETMRSADAGFFGALRRNAPFMSWVQQVEPRGFDALRWRVQLGEAANFVADAACALGRDTVHEVIPLFLIGLDKLNSVLAMLNDTISEHKLDDWFARPATEDTSAGLLAVQQSLLLPRDTASPWDVLELMVPADQLAMTVLLVESLRVKCFQANTPIYTSSSTPSKIEYPHILIHGVDATSSPTEALLSGVSQSKLFYAKNRTVQEGLRIISIQPPSVEIGEAVDGGFARQGNRLLAPGPWGASPLQLVLLTAQQMRFARPGRFILDDTSCALLTKEVYVPDREVVVLLSSPAETNKVSSRPSEVALRATLGKLPQDVTDVVGSPDRTMPSGIFIAMERFATLEKLVADGIRPQGNFLTDVVFGSKLDKGSWIELYCSFGFAEDKADLAWDAAQRLSVEASSEPTTYSSGGDKVSMYRFGSLEEYKWLTTEAKKDPVVNSLAFMAATLAWREQWTED